MSVLLSILSLVPGLAMTWRLQGSRRETTWLAFGVGVVALALVLIPGSWVVSRIGLESALPWQRAFLFAALPEETMKVAALGVILIALRGRGSVLRLAIAVSLGFATAESIVFALRSTLQGALIHMLVAVPAHAVFGAVLARVWMADLPRGGKVVAAWAAAVLAHGLYDLPLFQLTELSPGPSRLLWFTSWVALYATGLAWTWHTLRRAELSRETHEREDELEEPVTPAPGPLSMPRSVPPTRTARPGTRAPRS